MTTQPTDLVARLKADHLAEAELRAEVEAQDPKTPVPVIDPNNPKAKEEYTFQFSWKDGRGKLWEGEFTDKIMSIGTRQMAGALRARFATVSADRLDTFTSHINMMVSHMTFSLTARPEWAKDLRELTNVDLLQALYEEVSSHEETFFGLK
jgi:hypothetical protein